MPVMDIRVDPNPESYDSVPFYNFTDRNFTVEDHAMWNGKPYEVASGEIKFYPVFLANHLAKHLINREIMIKNPALLLDQPLRSEIAKKILISEDEASLIKAKVKEPDRSNPVSRIKTVKEEKIDESEAKTSPKTKGYSEDELPSIEHTKEFAKEVDVKPMSRK